MTETAVAANEISVNISRYSWYHQIEVAPGVVTPGDSTVVAVQRPFMDLLREQNLAGKSVLDIGCRDGLFSFEAEKMGAANVLGIDNDLSRGAVEFLIPHFRSKVTMQEINLYDFTVAPSDRYDVVLCAGVIYHLRFPFFGLKRIADATRPGGVLLIETAMFVTQQQDALLYCPPPEESPYEPTSVSFYNDAGLAAALSSLGFGEIECRNIMMGERTHVRGWDNVPSALAGKNPPVIVRATYQARKHLAEKRGDLDRYWYDIHTLSSNPADKTKFLRDRH
jgi:SAM-dependent methyltransferase